MPYSYVQFLEYDPKMHKAKKDIQVTSKPYCLLQGAEWLSTLSKKIGLSFTYESTK